MPTMGIMASRSRGIPLPKIERQPCAYSRQSHTFFSDSISGSLPNPTSLFSVFLMEIILSEICLLKLVGIPHRDELWATVKNENMTFNCARKKKGPFSRHMFSLFVVLLRFRRTVTEFSEGLCRQPAGPDVS